MILRILLISLLPLFGAHRDDGTSESCFVTNGALMDRASMKRASRSLCDITSEACFAFVPDIDTSEIELGCAPKSTLPSACFNNSFSCDQVSPFRHNDKSGFLCCCRSSDCNDPTKIDDLLPHADAILHESDRTSYKWWHFPIIVFCGFAVVMLFGVIASVLMVLKNITKIVVSNQTDDYKMYSKIQHKKIEQLRLNRDTIFANVDIAVQELYHFLVHRRLVFSDKRRKIPRQKPPTQHVVIKISLRTLDELEIHTAEQPHLTLHRSTFTSENNFSTVA